MLGDPTVGMVGMQQRVLDQLADVVAFDAVEDLVALPPGLHQTCHPQLGEVLGDTGLGLSRLGRKLVDRTFTLEQEPEQSDASGVGEHSEQLHGEPHLLVRRHLPTYLRLCVHTHIMR